MIRPALIAAVAAATALLGAPAAASACDRYAAVGGNASDANPGSVDAPFATVEKLAASLAPGQTGCLSGTFTGTQFTDEGGSAGAPILLKPTPGSTAKLPNLELRDPGPHIIVEGVTVERASNGIAVRVLADDVTLRAMDISHPTAVGSCVYVGSGADVARRTVLEGLRVHACASSAAVVFDSAEAAALRDSYVYGTAGNGIQFYEGPTGVTVERVIIDGSSAAVHFAGSATRTTTNVTVRSSILSRGTGNLVTSFWDGAVGSGNSVAQSCADRSEFQAENGWSLDEATMTFATPGFFNADGGDFRMGITSACRSFGPLPGARTGDATSVTPTSATITGFGTPRWQEATAYVEYGPRGGATVRSSGFALGAGAVEVPVSVPLNALQPGTTYDYRVVAANTSSGGERAGETRSFTTAPAPDADGDGVPDGADQCPFAARGPVDANGDGCADDSDRDGIADAGDACPVTARGAFDANRDGCPDDGDGDGVLDQDDACDSIPAGKRDVNADGCPDPYERVAVKRPSHGNVPTKRRGRVTRVKVVRLTLEAERGATVRMRCRGGCSLDKRIVSKGRTLRLHRYLPRRGSLPARARIELYVVKAGRIGTYFRMRIDRKVGSFVTQELCMKPGTLKPEKGDCQP